MTDPQAASEPRDHRVQAALQDYLERVDRGETVDRDAFLEQHPEIADELRSFIETDENFARLAEESTTSSTARRDAQTLVPKKLQGNSSATDSGQLPQQFGRYRVLKPLGSGAMGTVYLAEDTQLQRNVALKTPSFDEDDSGELLERFYREARAAAVLRHSNICPVFDVDQIDGRHFISMAYIEGRPLSAYIQPDNPPPERQILLIIRKLALALREAHDQGIVHRDLKPGNIMIDPRGEPIIMDFGLARRVTTDEDHRITQSGVLVGSPAYMSPEQVEGQPDRVGPASDQYSLGVILYEMLTGQLPFRGSITGVIGQILTKTPTPPGELREDLDSRIEALCQKMMAKRADDRFPSVKNVADEVARILKTPRPSTPTSLAATGGSANAPASTPSVTDSNVASLYEAARKCMRKRDYEQVVQMLETIPEDRRNDEVMRLLAKARQLSDEVQFLLAEIDEALHANDTETARKKSDELLKLKPGHHRAQEVRQQCARGGRPFVRRKRRTRDGRRVAVGSWIPWAVAVVAVVAFGISSWLVYDYLHSNGTVPDPVQPAVVEPQRAVAPFDANAAARHQQQWADYLEVPLNDTNSIGMEFQLIPPGEFASQASDGDATRIDRPFYLGVHEVTQEQYQQVIGVNPSDRKAPQNPVHNVTWDQAEAFCQRLSELPESSGYVFRLPTEAEWEHACRAGSTAAYSFGDDASRLGEYAWFSDNANSTMHPVGRKTANAWGLHDMHANVWEWCRDEFDSNRPIRGGCWYSGAELCSSGARRLIPTSDQSVLVGFRVVREIEPAPPVADGWINLFNGRDLTGWTPVESQGGWHASSGVIHCDDQGQGWLATQQEYSDFELELEFKLTPAANSGVFLRMPRNASPNGAGLLEVQLLDETAAKYAGIPADRRSGALYDIAEPQPRVNIEPNVWHSLRILAAGPRITVHVNGRQVIDTSLDSVSRLRQEKPDALRATGFIGLQRLNSSVEFRNIRIKEPAPGTD